MTCEAGIAIYRDVGLRRPFSSGNDGCRHRAEARDEHVDRQDDDRMLPYSRQPGIPDVASERLH